MSGIFDQRLFSIGDTPVTIASLVVAILLVVGSFLLGRLSQKLVSHKLLARTNLSVGVRYVLGRFTGYLVLFLGIAIALQTLGIRATTLAAFGAALGVGIGFGLQDIVKNFVAGLILLVERPFQVGDRIEIDKVGAEVVEIRARATILRTNDDVHLIVPNAKFINETVVNRTFGRPIYRLHVPVLVAFGADPAAVEEALGLPPTTVKIGIMDEERRTSINLEACIARAAERVIFVNTGFLDRTGDEIHSDFEAGPVVRKDDEKSTIWLRAYEDRNVDVALRAGFAGHAQIGKGMWAQPAGMRAMLDTKGAQPKAGANTAWVPSPTAATLHALHYLETDVKAVQAELAARPLTDRSKLLVVPVLPDGGAGLTDDEKRHELETNAQSILGYVVRWVGLGIGCSTVPDLEGVGLMEDRATLRISSQEIANWLRHGLVDEAQVRETFARMAVLVDEQNAREPGYQPMSKDLENSPSFQAALELVFAGRQEPNGYTERALTHWRQRAKAGGNGDGTRAAVLDDDAPAPAG